MHWEKSISMPPIRNYAPVYYVHTNTHTRIHILFVCTLLWTRVRIFMTDSKYITSVRLGSKRTTFRKYIRPTMTISSPFFPPALFFHPDHGPDFRKRSHVLFRFRGHFIIIIIIIRSVRFTSIYYILTYAQQEWT